MHWGWEFISSGQALYRVGVGSKSISCRAKKQMIAQSQLPPTLPESQPADQLAVRRSIGWLAR